MASDPIATAFSIDVRSLVDLQALCPELQIITVSAGERYDALCKSSNPTVKARPFAIITPTHEAQLATVVRYCSSATPPIPLTIRSGGHDIHGRHVLEGVALLDVSKLNNIRLSADSKAVTIGAGVKGASLLRALDLFSLTTGTGWCHDVGMVGWACGGGYGVASGPWGLGADNVVGARLITPSGIPVDTDNDPELLWAVRGAGLGNFGVISELRLRVRPRPRQLAGMITFPLQDAKTILGEGLYRMSTDGTLPPNYTGEFMIATTPEAPIMIFLWSWIADPELDADGEEESIKRGWQFLQNFKSLGTVLADTVEETTMRKFQESLKPYMTTSAYAHMNSSAISQLSPEVVDILMKNSPPLGSPSAIVCHHSHGQTEKRNGPKYRSYPVRGEHYILGVTGMWNEGSTQAFVGEQVHWANTVHEAISKTTALLESRYWSFARPEHCNSLSFFEEEGVAKLGALKRRYNPSNAFPAAFPVL